jgi:hypothetical protein
MKQLGVLLAGFLMATCIPALAQHGDEHGNGRQGGAQQHGAPQHGEMQRGGPQRGGIGGGYIPQHGPNRGHGEARQPTARQPESHANVPQRDFRDQAGHPNAPHVHPDDRWVGHDVERGHYHLDRPWAHGHFPGGYGPSYVYRLRGGRPSRFFLDGFYFSIAPQDLGYVNGWSWDSDDLILYDDPDDPGYYLAYNPRTGTYVHVLYMGS